MPLVGAQADHEAQQPTTQSVSAHEQSEYTSGAKERVPWIRTWGLKRGTKWRSARRLAHHQRRFGHSGLLVKFSTNDNIPAKTFGN